MVDLQLFSCGLRGNGDARSGSGSCGCCLDILLLGTWVNRFRLESNIGIFASDSACDMSVPLVPVVVGKLDGLVVL